MKIDIFSHVLLPQFCKKMLDIDAGLLQKMPFLQNPLLLDMKMRQEVGISDVKQVLSFVNVNPEDYLEKNQALDLVKEANHELLDTVLAYPKQFFGAVTMLALNLSLIHISAPTSPLPGRPPRSADYPKM